MSSGCRGFVHGIDAAHRTRACNRRTHSSLHSRRTHLHRHGRTHLGLGRIPASARAHDSKQNQVSRSVKPAARSRERRRQEERERRNCNLPCRKTPPTNSTAPPASRGPCTYTPPPPPPPPPVAAAVNRNSANPSVLNCNRRFSIFSYGFFLVYDFFRRTATEQHSPSLPLKLLLQSYLVRR
jgi:hypothetical protein